jgi:hypothetical protein
MSDRVKVAVLLVVCAAILTATIYTAAHITVT